MAFYELVFIMRGDLSPEAAASLCAGYEKLLKQQGGKVKKTEQWGLLSLAYPVKKNKKGHYFLLQLDAPHAALAELERRMRLDEDNLRFLTTRIDDISKEDSVFLARHKEHKEKDKEREEAKGKDRDEAKDKDKDKEKTKEKEPLAPIAQGAA